MRIRNPKNGDIFDLDYVVQRVDVLRPGIFGFLKFKTRRRTGLRRQWRYKMDDRWVNFVGDANVLICQAHNNLYAGLTVLQHRQEYVIDFVSRTVSLNQTTHTLGYVIDSDYKDGDFDDMLGLHGTFLSDITDGSSEWNDVKKSMGLGHYEYRIKQIERVHNQDWHDNISKYNGTDGIGWHGFGTTDLNLILRSKIGLDPSKSKEKRRRYGAGTYLTPNFRFCVNPSRTYTQWSNNMARVLRVHIVHSSDSKKDSDEWLFTESGRMLITHVVTIERLRR